MKVIAKLLHLEEILIGLEAFKYITTISSHCACYVIERFEEVAFVLLVLVPSLLETYISREVHFVSDVSLIHMVYQKSQRSQEYQVYQMCIRCLRCMVTPDTSDTKSTSLDKSIEKVF